MYIPPTATCTFAEVVQAGGNCPTYTDTATLIAPGGAQFVATGTLPDNVLVTIQYPVPTPAGLMAEGIYTLVSYLKWLTDLLVGFCQPTWSGVLCNHHADS